MDDPWKRPTFSPAIYYKAPKPMLDWLERAFAFETMMVITDDKDEVAHAEMSYGDGIVMVGAEWADWAKSPASVGGANTQNIHVRLDENIDGHCERARAAGAVIAMEPADQFYGDRVYRAVDPEGHGWTFAQPVREVSREEAEQASGLKIEGWLDPKS
jgi:uncharacterized glyoxalase superfamily protein PhnB